MWWKILLIIFAVIFLILWLNIHLIISYDGEFKLLAGVGLIRLDVLKLLDNMKKKPKKEKPKGEKKEKKEDKKEEKEPKEKKPNVFKEVIELRGVDGAVDLISEFASLLSKFGGGLVKHFVIRKLFVRYSVTGKDAADTAVKFGAISAAIFAPLGVISSAAQVKKHDVQIYPDYLGNINEQKVVIHISYKILSLLAVALGAVKDFIQINNRQKSINARIKARSKARKMQNNTVKN